ncbi:MAG: helix-turn-helix domain-containing protein, partial [Lachnospiraceae bacterium]|nr:helix-turn-helix domain-containing protein [Lachnospiraceae bacterium]
VILYHLPKFRETNYKDYLTSQLTPILKDFSGRKLNLFFSRPFTTIGQFSAAYTQAENVCRILHGNPEQMFSFYEDYWVQDLFLMNSSDELMFSYCEPALLDLINSGTKKSRQQLQILYEYLNCDRKLTEVAKKLDMHRNNVLYHIRQIEETYAMDLNNPQPRL